MDEAKELIGEDRFEALAKNTEASLNVFAANQDIELDGEATDDVLEFICEYIVRSDVPVEFADDLIDEMSEPESIPAMTNIDMAVGGAADDNESLATLRNKLFEDKYGS